MTVKPLAALLGFAFVAAWIGCNFGYALLCVLGAGVSYAVASVAVGDTDLGKMQQGLRSAEVPARPPADTPAYRGAPRVR